MIQKVVEDEADMAVKKVLPRPVSAKRRCAIRDSTTYVEISAPRNGCTGFQYANRDMRRISNQGTYVSLIIAGI